MFPWGLSCKCLCTRLEPQPTSASPSGLPLLLGWSLDLLWALGHHSDSDVAQFLRVLAPKVHSCQSKTIFICGNIHCLLRYSIDSGSS